MAGLSTILTIVILSLIMISMITFFYTWSIIIFDTVTNPAQTAVKNTISEMGRNIKIVSATNTTEEEITVYVKNIGTNDIDLSYMTAYLDDNIVGFDC